MGGAVDFKLVLQVDLAPFLSDYATGVGVAGEGKRGRTAACAGCYPGESVCLILFRAVSSGLTAKTWRDLLRNLSRG